MPKTGEPASFDLSVSESLAPHVITVLLTDDLLPIGTRQAGQDISQAEVSTHSNGEAVGGVKQTTGFVRQISTDNKSKPQVCSYASLIHCQAVCFCHASVGGSRIVILLLTQVILFPGIVHPVQSQSG